MMVSKNEHVGTITLTLDGHDVDVLKRALWHKALDYVMLLRKLDNQHDAYYIELENKLREMNNMSAAIGGNVASV